MIDTIDWESFGAAFGGAINGARLTLFGLIAFAWLIALRPIGQNLILRMMPSVLLSALSIDAVLHPLLSSNGIQLDLRCVLLLIAGLFTGFPESLLPVMVVLLLRFSIANWSLMATVPPCVDIALSYGAGLVLRRVAGKQHRDVALREALGAAMLVPLTASFAIFAVFGWSGLSEPIRAEMPYLMLLSSLICIGFGLLLELLVRPVRAEAALQDSDFRLRQLVEGSTQGVVIIDQSKPLFANRTFATMFGFASPADVIALPSIDGLFGPSLAAITPREAFRTDGEALLHVRKYPATRKDGSSVWIDFEVRRTGWVGRPVLQVTAVDVTELKALEDSLHHRQALLVEHQQSILELVKIDFRRYRSMEAAAATIAERGAASLGVARLTIWLIDADREGRRLLAGWDRTAQCPVLADGGWTPMSITLREIIKRNETRIHENVLVDPSIDAEERAVFRTEGITSLMAVPYHVNNRYSGTVCFAGRDGPRHWTIEDQMLGSGIASLTGLALLTVLHQQALAALDAASEGICIRDADGDLVYANAQARDLVGIGSDDPLDQDVSESLPNVIQPVAASGARLDQKWQRLDGSIATLSVSSGQLPDGGSLTLFKDVSDERRLDAERRDLEAQLLRAGKMEAVGRLAGGIAHEFNNLLGSLFGYAGFLIEDLAPGTPQRRYAERINLVSHRAKDLVRQVLAFSRTSDAGRSRFDVREMLREGEEILRATLPISTRLEFKLGAEPVWLHGNVGQLSQILINLCINSNDAIESGEGVIAVSLRVRTASSSWVPPALEALPDESVRAGALAPGLRYAVISVQDNGKGMSAASLSRVFEPFFTTKEQGQGTGLGLAVVHGLVLEHQGAYSVTSRPGMGTVFDLYFPLSEAPSVAETKAADEPVRNGSERVLIVDDETELADVVKAGLSRLGYDVMCVHDPEDALTALSAATAPFDALITDEVLPKMKGIKLIPKVRAACPDLKIILWTGFSDNVSEQTALEAGADLFLYKPVETNVIADHLRRLLG
jgi:PAS domain S-box-containing protein